MTAGSGTHQAAPPLGWRIAIPGANAAIWAILGLALVVALQLPLVVRRAINWDEFWYYSQVHELANHALTRSLQTFQTRAFVWLMALPGSGVDHIVVARGVMFGCELLSASLIAAIAARFSDRTVGLLCALCYLSTGFVLQHGYEFRTDPITAALLMSALWLLLASRLDAKAILLSGLLLAVAGMFTIKAVLYGPAFLGIAWLRWKRTERPAKLPLRFAAIVLAAATAFGLLLWLHSRGVVPSQGTGVKTSLANSAQMMFALGAKPYWIVALKAALASPVVAAVIAFTPALLWKSSRPMHERLALAGLFLPVTTLIFYHNTAPYFYAFMLPPVLIAACLAVTVVVRRYGVAALAGLLTFNAAVLWAIEPPSPIDKQRALLAAADTMFPQPVAYFDFSAFLGKFPKANIFMTPWGIRQYQSGAIPSMRATMAQRTIPLVVENDPMFTRAFYTRQPVLQFLPDDLAALRASYVHFWGPYWVAGKDIPAGSGEVRFDLLVPGPYTVRGCALVIDGRTVPADTVIALKRGSHRVSGLRDKPASLIWGNRIARPAVPPPPPPYDTPF